MDLYHLFVPAFLVFLAFLYVLILFESGFRDHGKLTKKSTCFLCVLPKALSNRKKCSENP
ncbi:MAG TPA: hypothetical protein DD651_04050 [Trichococcus sp.]|nr:hypothetical protein [Trichococcus sp.]